MDRNLFFPTSSYKIGSWITKCRSSAVGDQSHMLIAAHLYQAVDVLGRAVFIQQFQRALSDACSREKLAFFEAYLTKPRPAAPAR